MMFMSLYSHKGTIHTYLGKGRVGGGGGAKSKGVFHFLSTKLYMLSAQRGIPISMHRIGRVRKNSGGKRQA